MQEQKVFTKKNAWFLSDNLAMVQTINTSPLDHLE